VPRVPDLHGGAGTLLLTVLLMGGSVMIGAAQSTVIAGSWQGTSTCVDLSRYPACHNEQVIYNVRPMPGTRDTVTLRADKMVNGAREFMYELPFIRQRDSSWTADFENPRYQGRWVLRVSETRMSGELLDLPSRQVVRRMSLTRTRSP
jgi:hypothetical protein